MELLTARYLKTKCERILKLNFTKQNTVCSNKVPTWVK